jgi:hypothetical protein
VIGERPNAKLSVRQAGTKIVTVDIKPVLLRFVKETDVRAPRYSNDGPMPVLRKDSTGIDAAFRLDITTLADLLLLSPTSSQRWQTVTIQG